MVGKELSLGFGVSWAEINMTLAIFTFTCNNEFRCQDLGYEICGYKDFEHETIDTNSQEQQNPIKNPQTQVLGTNGFASFHSDVILFLNQFSGIDD